jgi:hypothetical protein
LSIDQNRIDDLIAAPSESLNVEIKRWINPDEPDGVAKLIKAALAIRNRNGGFLLIGFDNNTLMPDGNRPKDVNLIFHVDKIQGIISKFASDVFEIAVGFGERNGHVYPVIVIPEGVTAPVAARCDLKDGSKFLIREGAIYFRTLKSNGTPSTAKARPNDWQDITEICFENRDADIGRFLRRQLAGGSVERFIEILTGLRASAVPPSPTLSDRATALINESEQKFEKAVVSREQKEIAAIKDGGTWSVALVIDPPHAEAIPSSIFLNTVAGANPQYTGWPVWLDSRNSADRTSNPKVIDNAWQALIVSLEEGWFKHVDFIRLDPTGSFYLSRILEDDLTDKVPRGTALDAIMVILRVAEAIAVGLSLVKALGWQADARLGFGFRWTRLSGRELCSWASPLASMRPGRTVQDSSVDTFVELPLDTPVSAIASYVEQATRNLFVRFDGYTFPIALIEHWLQRLIERRI